MEERRGERKTEGESRGKDGEEREEWGGERRRERGDEKRIGRRERGGNWMGEHSAIASSVI